MTMTAEEARQKLIAGGRILDAEGQADLTRGHISVRVPGDPTCFFMKPHSYGFDEITLENIVVCNLEGEKVGGGGRRHSEVFIHSEIYLARPDVNGVVHSHSPTVVPFTAPGAPVNVRATTVDAKGAIAVSWAPGPDNGRPITGPVRVELIADQPGIAAVATLDARPGRSGRAVAAVAPQPPAIRAAGAG